jgi:endonuclease YncB( thermonuclease family)
MGCCTSCDDDLDDPIIVSHTPTKFKVDSIVGPVTIDEDLIKCNNDIPIFSFNGLETQAKIVDVYDGDTFKACFKHNGKIIKYTCRTTGYDSPEMKPLKTKPNRDIEIAAAKRARDYFKMLVNFEDTKSIVYLKFGKFDKYGRILTTVFTDDNPLSVNDIMLKNGQGTPYDGGTKIPFLTSIISKTKHISPKTKYVSTSHTHLTSSRNYSKPWEVNK